MLNIILLAYAPRLTHFTFCFFPPKCCHFIFLLYSIKISHFIFFQFSLNALIELIYFFYHATVTLSATYYCSAVLLSFPNLGEFFVFLVVVYIQQCSMVRPNSALSRAWWTIWMPVIKPRLAAYIAKCSSSYTIFIPPISKQF